MARQARGASSEERGLSAPPHRAARRSARSPTTMPSQDPAATPCGVSPPSRRRPRETPAGTGGSGHRVCATAIPRRSTTRSSATATGFEFALFCQWLADRQLGRAAARARGIAGWRSASIAILRSARRRTGRKPGRMRARWRTASRSERRPIRFPSKGRTGACRRPIRSPARARAGLQSAPSTAPTCATPACCASITRWACSACSSFPTARVRRRAPISPIRLTISSAISRSKANARNAWWLAKTSAPSPRVSAIG